MDEATWYARRRSGRMSIKLAVVMVLAVVFVVGYVLPARRMARRQELNIACHRHLEAIAQALRTYADDNEGVFPPALDYLLQYDEITPKVLLCPANPVVQPGTQSSYVYLPGHVREPNVAAEESAIIVYHSSAQHFGEEYNWAWNENSVQVCYDTGSVDTLYEDQWREVLLGSRSRGAATEHSTTQRR